MSTQAMGSQGGGGQQSQFGNSPRQGSMYNLTLNEVQSQLGEPLHSMNLDELLRNVLPVEGDQPLELDLENTSAKLASVSGIQRQGSLTLTRELSKKTVDEVWKDIQQGHDRSTGERAPAQERQPTLGEMTLEDFLLKAGIVADTDGFDKTRTDNIDNMGSSGSNGLMTGASVYPQGVHWLKQYQPMPALQQQHQVQQPVGAYVPSHPVQQPSVVGTSSMLECGYTESSSPMMGTFSDSQTPGRKRNASGDIVEKTVERRQKRMIKNRESAARSRARKQAYTNELENKVNRLEEENEKLKKQKELDKILYSAPPPNPKFQLRRTSSSPI